MEYPNRVVIKEDRILLNQQVIHDVSQSPNSITNLKDLLYCLTGCPNLEDPQVIPFGFVPLSLRQVFYLSSFCYCTVNLKPFVPGHVLVMSRRPVISVDQLTDDEANDLMGTIRRTVRLIKDTYKTDSVTIAIQDGRPAGMTIPHLHVHIMPRRSHDAVSGDMVYTELEKAEFFKAYQNPCISGLSHVRD